MLGAAARIKRAPLLGVKRRGRPAGGFKEAHQFVVGNFFARHRAWRPAIEEERFDRVIGLSNFAAFNHKTKLSLSSRRRNLIPVGEGLSSIPRDGRTPDA